MLVRDPPALVQLRPSWWIAGDQTGTTQAAPNAFSSIALPYLPFLSNCDAFDSHGVISRLVEDHPGCSIVAPADTIASSMFPWVAGFTPRADNCGANMGGLPMTCMYEEDVFASSAQLRWYEQPGGAVLWHLTRDAVRYSTFAGDYTTSPPAQLWGRGAWLNNIQPDELIPVAVVDTATTTRTSLVPRLITLDMQYFQRDTYTKRIVHGALTYGNYCTVSTSASKVSVLAAAGVPKCSPGDYTYTLRLVWRALPWLDLVNFFQFDAVLYVLLFSLFGSLLTLSTLLVYVAHAVLRRRFRSHQFRCTAFARLALSPPAAGVLLASAPMIAGVMMTLAWWVSSASADPVNTPNPANFEKYAGSWFNTGALDLAHVTSYRMSRVGTSLLAAGILLLLLTSVLIAPDGTGGPLEAGAGAQLPSADSIDAAASEAKIRDSSGGNDDARQDEIWRPMRWKRGLFLCIAAIVIAATLVLMEFSYSTTFAAQLYWLIVAVKLGELITEQVLRSVVRDVLMIAPVFVVLQVVEVFILQGADTLSTFLLAYSVRFVTQVCFRLYLEPFIKRMLLRLPVLRMYIRRMRRKYVRLSREERAADERTWQRVKQDVELDSGGVEPILESMYRYSTETTALMIQPVLQTIIVLLDASPLHKLQITHIPLSYGVRNTNIVFYALFFALIIPFNLLADTSLFNALEALYGWQLHGYLAYQRYRYQTRDREWHVSSTRVDSSIRPSLQRVDMLCFSAQYYFMLTLFAWGCLFTAIGITVHLRNGYDVFGDWTLVVNLLAVYAVFRGARIVLPLAAKLLRLWYRKTLEGSIEDEIAARLAANNIAREEADRRRRQMEALSREDMKEAFMRRNRGWLLAHLADVVNPAALEHVMPDERTVRRYLQSLLDKAEAALPGALAGEDADGGVQTGVPPLTSSSPARDAAKSASATPAIARMWAVAGRRRVNLRTIAETVLAGLRRNACDACGMTALPAIPALQVYFVTRDANAQGAASFTLDRGGLAELLDEYTALNALPTNAAVEVAAWKAFVRQRAPARVASLCTKCAAAAGMATRRASAGASAITAPGAVDANENDDVLPPRVNIAPGTPAARLLQKWLAATRAAIGGSFPRPEATSMLLDYMQRLRASEQRESARLRQGAEVETAALPADVARSAAAAHTPARRWLFAARGARVLRLHGMLDAALVAVDAAVADMHPSQEWFFGRDNRERGQQLRQELVAATEGMAALQQQAEALSGAAWTRVLDVASDDGLRVESESMATAANTLAATVQPLVAAASAWVSRMRARIAQLQAGGGPAASVPR